MTSSDLAEISVLKATPYKGLSDFTLYFERKTEDHSMLEVSEAIEELLRNKRVESSSPGNIQAAAPQSSYSYADSIRLNYENASEEFRSLICSCYRNEHYSVTLRSTSKRQSGGMEYVAPASALNSGGLGQESGYDPKVADAQEPDEDRAKFLFRWAEYSNVLSDKIFPPRGDSKNGLVIVAGSTAAGKSKIIRALIYHYVTNRIRKQKQLLDRRPHLLTFEDPIETLYYHTPQSARVNGLDYTPRQKGADVRHLNQLFEDSLRQTPAAVYIGETRHSSDWKALVDFAAKGHLVFTTCHAGSLTEVMSVIRTAAGGGTAAERSALASRLLAVVHLRAEKISSTVNQEDPKGALLPALWLRTPAGINFFTGDGLSAVLPHSAEGKNKPDSRYCFGRSYFASKLLEQPNSSASHYGKNLKEKAVAFDLEGL